MEKGFSQFFVGTFPPYISSYSVSNLLCHKNNMEFALINNHTGTCHEINKNLEKNLQYSERLPDYLLGAIFTDRVTAR